MKPKSEESQKLYRMMLDRKGRILFSGDEFMARGKEITGSILHWKECLEKLLAHRDEFDILCAGGGVLSADLVDGQYDLVCRVLGGEEGEVDHPQHPPLKADVDEQGRKIYNRICRIRRMGHRTCRRITDSGGSCPIP